MAIKIKILNFSDTTIDKPEEGYILLGFNGDGNLIQMGSDGVPINVVPTEPTGDYTEVYVKYLTVGARLGGRVIGEYSGTYTYAQGDENIASGDTSFVQGENSQSAGEISFARGRFAQANGSYSHAAGEYVHADDECSYVFGKGYNGTFPLVSDGINSFVHQYLTAAATKGTSGDYSVILGGHDHDIGTGSDNSVILGGYSNTISTSSTGCTIIGGHGNIIPTGKFDVTYIGRNSLSSVTNDRTVYITRLAFDTAAAVPTAEEGIIYYDGVSPSASLKTYINGGWVSLTSTVGTYVTLADNQTISGQKIFTNTNTFNNTIYVNSGITTQNGSSISIISSAPTSSTNNGNINITGGTSSSTSYDGGSVSIRGGYGHTSTKRGGDVNIYGGETRDINVGARGGDVNIYGGLVVNIEAESGNKGGDINIVTPVVYRRTGNINIVTSDTPSLPYDEEYSYGLYSSGTTGGTITIRTGRGSDSNGQVGNTYYGVKMVMTGGDGGNGRGGTFLLGNDSLSSTPNYTDSLAEINGKMYVQTVTGTTFSGGTLWLNTDFKNHGNCMNSYSEKTNSTTGTTVSVNDTPAWNSTSISLTDSYGSGTDRMVYISIYTQYRYVTYYGVRVYVIKSGVNKYFLNWWKEKDVDMLAYLETNPVNLSILVPSDYSTLYVETFSEDYGNHGSQEYEVSWTVWPLGHYKV